MSEMNPDWKKTPPIPSNSNDLPSGFPEDPGERPVEGKKTIEPQNPLATAEIKATDSLSEQSKKPISWRIIGILSAVLFLLIALFFIFIVFPQQRRFSKNHQAKPPQPEDKSSPTELTSVIPENLLIREPKYSELILTDDEFAGQASRSVRLGNPVFSQDIDPQMAALADAFKKRLELSLGNPTGIGGNAPSSIIKGEFRGFKITVIKKIMRQKLTSEEITILTPKRGYIRSVDHVLDHVKDTDFSRFALELQNAGLEFFELPAHPAEKNIRMQLRAIHFLGKPISRELLISQKGVGGIILGMSIAQMEKLFVESHIVLKRKILVNDIYFDVYKILDPSNEPLFYVYENKGKVWGISLISEIFKTEKGIGIGSSLGAMRSNYPYIKIGYSEKKTPYIQLEGVEGLFIIQSNGVDFLKKVFPNNNKVISILLGDSPEFE